MPIFKNNEIFVEISLLKDLVTNKNAMIKIRF